MKLLLSLPVPHLSQRELPEPAQQYDHATPGDEHAFTLARTHSTRLL